MRNKIKALALSLMLFNIYGYSNTDTPNQDATKQFSVPRLAFQEDQTLEISFDTVPNIHFTGTWRTTPIGFGTDPSTPIGYWSVNGNVCQVQLNLPGAASNSTLLKYTLPFTSKYATSVTGAINYAQADESNGKNKYTARIDLFAGSNIINVYHDAQGTAWTSSQNKTVKFNFSYIIDVDTALNIQRQLIWIGNSLSACSGCTLVGGHKLPQAVYGKLLSYGMNQVPIQSYAVNGKSTTDHLADFGSIMRPCLRDSDFVFDFEWTVDISAEGLNAVQAYQSGCKYADSVHSCNSYIIVMTMLARDHTNDPAWMEARRDSLNDLIVANADNKFDWVIDATSWPLWNEESDCGNTAIYCDRLHLTDVGEDSLANRLSPILWSYINY